MPSSSSPASWLRPGQAPPTAFAQLDAVVSDGGQYGVLCVELAADGFAPLARHVARRARQCGRPALVAAGSELAEPWRELCRDLGLGDATEPAELASRIVRAAARAIVVAGGGQATAFGRDICGELRRLALDPEHQLLLVIVTTPGDGVGLPPALPRCPLSAREAPGEGQPEPCQLRLALGVQGLTEPDRHLWWEAVVAQGAPGPGAAADSLCALDAWWETARRPLASPAPRHAPVGAAGRELMALLGLARQALTGAEVRGLGRAAAALQGLLGAGLVEARPGDRFVARPGVWGAEAASCAGRRRLAAVLAGAGSDAVPADAWSLMRASELRAELGDAAVAEELAFAALRRVGEASAREDMWRRWQDTAARLGAQPGGPDDVAQLARLERSAELALSLGDGDRAERLARQALRLDGQRFETLLLHGRACLVRGDLEASSAALGTALERAATPLDRARASAALAELRHAQGDYAAAARHAADAGRGGPGLAARRARLGGRNVLGKLLLAQAAWRQAEQHFAADAQEAARVGDAEAELRARLNRAVAVLSAGRRDEARSCFEEILAESERRGALRAVGYALSNLAAIAILDLDFCRGLELSERAIGLRHRLGERLGLVRPITNLADLRLQLGLVSEAEQALRFGAKACGDGLPPSHQIYFGLCAARIELAQGRTGAAGRQLGAARAAAAAAADGALRGECERLGARLALEEGDLLAAELALGLAGALPQTPRGRAELGVLRAARARAAGESYLEAARAALGLALELDDAESLREANLLLFHALLQAGDAAGARARLRAAIAQRDRVAHALPAALQARLLGRRDLCELRRLELEWEGGAATAEAGPACASERVFHSRRERSEAREGDAGVLWRTSRSPTDASDRAAGCETPSEKPPAAAPRPPRRVLVGSSAPMLALKAAIARVAPTDAMVLITGETGTGKELVAEAIHEASPRRTGPLVKVNCAALVETLLLSELFGHERGAFTGAAARRLGRFEVAAGGTLFLDEIGDISPRTQVALLRVLQDGRFERVGGCAPLRADVRVVCATHRDLRAMVDAGAFREDLYYRLCGVELRVPPLRERVADLPELAASLLGSSTQAAGRSPLALGREALCALRRHRWPGNVRELENALRVAALFARGPEIAVADLADNVEGLASLAPSAGAGGEGSVQAVPSTDTAALVYGQVRRGTALADMKKKLERECIARALGEAGGNITRAAALLGMKRPRLSQLVKECGLAPVLKEIKP